MLLQLYDCYAFPSHCSPQKHIILCQRLAFQCVIQTWQHLSLPAPRHGGNEDGEGGGERKGRGNAEDMMTTTQSVALLRIVRGFDFPTQRGHRGLGGLCSLNP